MMEFIRSLSDPASLASYLVAFAVFATAMSMFMPYLRGDKLETRLKSVANQRERLKKQSRAALESKSIRRESKGVMSDVSSKLNLQNALEDPTIVDKLSQAGYRGPGPVSTFYFFRMTMPFVGAVLALLYVFYVKDHGFTGMMKWLVPIVGGMAAGFYAPNLYVGNAVAKRQKSIMRAFPDALDMLLICVESGMSIELGFGKVGAEIGSASPELAEELTLTTAELSYLPERVQAYDNLSKRTGHEGVKAVCMALSQAEKYGTPLGDALRVMSKENRDMRMSAAEKKAAALPAKLTVPMILFFLPVLFLVVLGPAYIKYNDMQGDNAEAPQVTQLDPVYQNQEFEVEII